MSARVVAIIPALDEEGCIAAVVRGIAPHVAYVVVIDNGSADATAERARAAGAEVVLEPRRGYGRACLAGLARARELHADVALFLDGDGSDHPDDAPSLLEHVVRGRADIALGVRRSDLVEPGAMTPVQRFGNWLAPVLMRASIGARYHDMPPFKACQMAALEQLALGDTGHGFTIEMMVKAHLAKQRVVQVPVRCRARRAGTSKVSGTIVGASRAGFKILTTIARHSLSARR